ncbi:HdeD family acid-resistance protein [Oscillibacter sp.]|uniref:HdeD family acid-resistance protein n=1 Tax=Oscillibacter sp. TaxID=1945593 RepID=UPI00260787F1|nr:DUF308 domain-containing protein [Oscillibacter sp.]MDD3347008.1 DUF308 domain-containing protein [Oscillibacter sp.]
MSSFFKRVKADALISSTLYALLGLVLLLWPAPSTRLLCTALGLVLLACGLGDLFVFLRQRDGSLYAAGHLILGVILAAVGIWLMARPTLIAVIIPRIIGVLICIHGAGNLSDANALRKAGSARHRTALILALVSLALGAVLIFDPFDAFTTVVRLIGAFLIYDGVSDLWITTQVSRAVRQAEQFTDAEKNAVDVEFRDTEE